MRSADRIAWRVGQPGVLPPPARPVERPDCEDRARDPRASGSALNLVSVVLPIHNQADHVESVVTRYEAALSAIDLPFELLLVLNACGDRSPEICEALAAANRSVRLVQTDRGG